MGNKLYSETAIQNIASSIRNKNGTQNTYTVSQMAQAILDIPTGGGQSYNNGKNNFWIYINAANTSVTATITSECKVDWGDGTKQTLSTDTTHTYTNTGVYIISGEYVTNFDVNSMDNIIYVECNKTAIPDMIFDATTYSLLKVVLNQDTEIASQKFYGSGVQEIYIPQVTNIGSKAFKDCSYLKNIIIPESVTFIRKETFYNCGSLTTLTIPANVTSIGQEAFYGCTSMQEYHFLPTTPPTLSGDVFFGTMPNNCIIYVPAESVTAYQTANNWSIYASHIQAEPTVGE
jgi:hypothetical protein